ncbi:indolepyruvate ferredoxin oxidoreductase subunit alpha [uncultured Desulfuromusa sp.]|uniref:indolepyruvate ferredoxin oxidoreductase subunit alpha n=1 Tax=uncultured Desulfuromusa sp. TaxID=219183 RepID=UPI002AA7B83F|nr:indolepyruvate ferredoxin oxidoreductase subunit alpha [uncultured Desulfuromusa sp.]
MKKVLLSGNEAIARGTYEAGALVACAYPGTPSTEILENITQYEDINSSWAPNEKVALEVGIGACFGGARALVTMKHVGVNVAADPLFTLSYTGVRGGLVLVTADDPELHSSQNEQDNRNFAKFAKVPMLEPADSQEALDFTRLAFEISEKFDTPVFLRTTTRISHSKSVVLLGERPTDIPEPKLERNPAKLVMLPGNARKRHVIVEQRTLDLEKWACQQPFNRVDKGAGKVGVITSGVSYQYVKETMPDADILKLGLVYPLPKQMIRDFAADYETLYVIEELDPFIEEQVRAMGIEVTGKDKLSICGELTPGRLQQGLFDKDLAEEDISEDLPQRPPNMCPGCPHRGVFMELNRAKAYVTGDIGCYTLGFMPPLSAMDTCICMGASIGNATGISKVLSEEEQRKVVAVIGDSTFLHTGINGLLDMVYNQSAATVIILDNRITAMTGRQENPTSGYALNEKEAPRVDMEQLCRAVGVKHVKVIDPYNISLTRKTIREEMARPETSVIITSRPCMLVPRDNLERRTPLFVDHDKCTGCKACLRLGCPAITWDAEKKKSNIDKIICTGCKVCQQTCGFDAFQEYGDKS